MSLPEAMPMDQLMEKPALLLAGFFSKTAPEEVTATLARKVLPAAVYVATPSRSYTKEQAAPVPVVLPWY